MRFSTPTTPATAHTRFDAKEGLSLRSLAGMLGLFSEAAMLEDLYRSPSFWLALVVAIFGAWLMWQIG